MCVCVCVCVCIYTLYSIYTNQNTIVKSFIINNFINLLMK